jgi:hypothetical protein
MNVARRHPQIQAETCSTTATPPAVPRLPATLCPHCDCVETPVVTQGTGPHAFKASCAHCGRFVRWVSKYSHEERIHRREQYRLRAMQTRAPSAAQLAYLVALGYHGDAPATRAVASTLIAGLRRGGESA